MQRNNTNSREQIDNELNDTFDTLTIMLNNIEITLKHACKISRNLRETDMISNWSRFYNKMALRESNYDNVVKTVTILSNWSRMYGSYRYKHYVSLWKRTIQEATCTRIRIQTHKRKRSIDDRREMLFQQLANVRWMRVAQRYNLIKMQKYVKAIHHLEACMFS